MWPNFFDIDNEDIITDIPIAKLKEQPEKRREVSVDRFIEQMDQRDKIHQQVISQAASLPAVEKEESHVSSVGDSSEEAAKKNR